MESKTEQWTFFSRQNQPTSGNPFYRLWAKAETRRASLFRRKKASNTNKMENFVVETRDVSWLGSKKKQKREKFNRKRHTFPGRAVARFLGGEKETNLFQKIIKTNYKVQYLTTLNKNLIILTVVQSAVQRKERREIPLSGWRISRCANQNECYCEWLYLFNFHYNRRDCAGLMMNAE